MGLAAWVAGLPARSQFGESDCETFGDGFWGQPVNTATSLAFVVAGCAILAGRAGERDRTIYGVLAVATGVGSFIAHGPSPGWAGPVHDAPLVALLAFVAADAVSDLAGRRIPAWWWTVPTVAAVAAGEVSEPARLIAQSSIAAVAVGASLLRLRYRPRTRQTILPALLLLGAGALIGTLSRTGMPLCDPDSPVQGHAVWHIMAALAVWRLTPVIGRVSARLTRHGNRL